MTPTRLIIVRHGETTWNLDSRYQGHADSALTETGLAQARLLAERFARERFSTLYSSDLGRANQTAQLIAAHTGCELHLDPRLRERSLGVMQGLRRIEFQERMPDHYARFASGDWDYAPPDGESTRLSVGRFVAAVTDLATRHSGQTIGVITHGGVLGSFLRVVIGIDSEQPRRFKRFNGSWNVFSFEAGSWVLNTWGDVSHLGELGNVLSLDDP
jgi:probable phosphoglycerate mutase